MTKPRTINLNLCFVDGRLRADGSAELKVAGNTKGGDVVYAVIRMAPDSLGIFGTEEHKIIREARSALSAAEAQLKGS